MWCVWADVCTPGYASYTSKASLRRASVSVFNVQQIFLHDIRPSSSWAGTPYLWQACKKTWCAEQNMMLLKSVTHAVVGSFPVNFKFYKVWVLMKAYSEVFQHTARMDNSKYCSFLAVGTMLLLPSQSVSWVMRWFSVGVHWCAFFNDWFGGATCLLQTWENWFRNAWNAQKNLLWQCGGKEVRVLSGFHDSPWGNLRQKIVRIQSVTQ
jgi:hypothetical protein